MKLSKKQIIVLLVLLGIFLIALWMLREEVLSLINMEG